MNTRSVLVAVSCIDEAPLSARTLKTYTATPVNVNWKKERPPACPGIYVVSCHVPSSVKFGSGLMWQEVQVLPCDHKPEGEYVMLESSSSTVTFPAKAEGAWRR